jgi:hypothetical protein
MATVVYNVVKGKAADGSFDSDTTGVDCLLMKVCPAGSQDPDLTTVAAILAVATAAECDFTNYVRKTSISGRSVSVDNANDRAQTAAATQTWTAAGGATNNNIVAFLAYIQGANDSARVPIALDVFTAVPTNGSDFAYAFTNGWLRWT